MWELYFLLPKLAFYTKLDCPLQIFAAITRPPLISKKKICQSHISNFNISKEIFFYYRILWMHNILIFLICFKLIYCILLNSNIQVFFERHANTFENLEYAFVVDYTTRLRQVHLLDRLSDDSYCCCCKYNICIAKTLRKVMDMI